MADKKTKTNYSVLSKKFILFAAIFGIAVFVFGSAEKVRGSDCDTLTGDDKDKCEELEKKAEAYKDLIEIKSKQQSTLQKQLELIDLEQLRNQKDITVIKGQIDNLTRQINDLDAQIVSKENLIRYQKAILSGLMQSYYEDYKDGVLNVVLINKNFSEAFNQQDYIGQTSAKLKDILTTIETARTEMQGEQNSLAEAKRENDDLKNQLEDKKTSLASNEYQKQTLLSRTTGEKEKYQKLLDDIENEINDLEGAIAGSADYSTLPPDKDGYFTWPVNPHNITQGYGMTSFARSGAYGGKAHNGVDFGIASRSRVFAARAGKVVGSGDNRGYAYGKWLAIEHTDSIGKKSVTLYGHLSSKNVVKGETVSEGEVIALSGNTGYSTGPHLHFSVFVSDSFDLKESKYVKGLYIPIGASVNPMKYL